MNLLNKKKVLNCLLVALSMAYPFAIYFSADHMPASYFTVGLMVVLLLRGFIQRDPMVLVAAVAVLGLYIYNAEFASIMYPVIVSSTFAVLLGWTLIFPPSLIERFARILEPDLSPEGVSYTRNVTIMWLVFSILNAGIALFTVILNDREIWLLYNGIISYILIGLLMAGEYIFRRFYTSMQRKI